MAVLAFYVPQPGHHALSCVRDFPCAVTHGRTIPSSFVSLCLPGARLVQSLLEFLFLFFFSSSSFFSCFSFTLSFQLMKVLTTLLLGQYVGFCAGASANNPRSVSLLAPHQLLNYTVSDLLRPFVELDITGGTTHVGYPGTSAMLMLPVVIGPL